MRKRSETAGIVERHHFVLGAVDEQDRHMHVLNFGQGIEFVAQQKLPRNQWPGFLNLLDDRCICAFGDQAGCGNSGRQVDRHRRAKVFTVKVEAIGFYMARLRQVEVGRQRVTGRCRFRWGSHRSCRSRDSRS